MLHRPQGGGWEIGAVSAPGGQRGIEGLRRWRGRGPMGGQWAEGVPSQRLQPPPPALSSVLAPGRQGPWAESSFLTPLITRQAALYYGTPRPPAPRSPLPTPPAGAPPRQLHVSKGLPQLTPFCMSHPLTEQPECLHGPQQRQGSGYDLLLTISPALLPSLTQQRACTAISGLPLPPSPSWGIWP